MGPKLEEVFGVSSGPILSYIKRAAVDDRFVEAVKADKQIVVYGSSKQGKTALVQEHLPYEKQISRAPYSEDSDLRYLRERPASTGNPAKGRIYRIRWTRNIGLN